MKHTSVNCCEYGVDLITTDRETGRVTMVNWTWEEVREFVHTHGVDVTETAGNMVESFLGRDDDGDEETDNE